MVKPSSSQTGNTGKQRTRRKPKDTQSFAHKRKNKTLNNYKKLLRKEKRDEDLQKVIKRQKYEKSGFKVNTYARIQKEADAKRKMIEEERIQKQKEQERKAKERKEARAEAAAKRRDRQKMYSKKTRKGQPYLSNQMNILLEKIQKNVEKEKANAALSK